MSLSIRVRHRRTFAVAFLVQILASACDLTSPIDPKDRRAITVPDDVALTVVASSLKATAVLYNEIDITWATSPSATGYEVWRSTNGPSGTYTQIAATSATVPRYADTGLLGSTQYCYEIRSFKTVGKNTTYAAFSSALCATTPAPPVAAPSQTEAVPNGRNLRVAWVDNSANEDGFRIDMASTTSGPWTQVAAVAANITTVSGNWEVAEHQACFRVTAYNAVGVSNPSTPDCTTIPAAPTNVLAKALDGQSITITWTDNSSVEDGYEVLRPDAGGLWTSIARLPANSTSYRDATVAVDVLYKYRVRALKDGGYSDVGPEVIAAIRTSAPAAPTNAWGEVDGSVFDYGGASLYIAWTDASTNEDGFRIEYSFDGGPSGWSLFATTPADSSAYGERSTQIVTNGCFRIIAFNSAGLSAPSNVACVEYHPAPADVGATVVDQQTIDVTWTDNASHETGYEVFRTSPYGGAWESIAVLPANATSFRDTGLTPGQEYCYWISMLGEPYYDPDPVYACATPSVAGVQSPAASSQIAATSAVRSGPPVRRIPRKHLAPPTPVRSRRSQ